jgi:8-oxo-dGTP pyrophosphatase MutT (NUDIX family)
VKQARDDEKPSNIHNRRPVDAATLIIVDESHAQPRILMGKRSKHHAFLPGKFVFPGGRVDNADSRINYAGKYHDATYQKLQTTLSARQSDKRLNGLGLAAIRETYEEAGILIGTRTKKNQTSKNLDWNDFFTHNIMPDISGLHFLAQAITPPRRVRRFNTRFFIVSAEKIAARLSESPSGELESLQWLPHTKCLELDLPRITKMVLHDLYGRIQDNALWDASYPAPSYKWRGKAFQRDLL